MSYAVAQEIASRLANITVANGYKTNAGQNVALGWRSIDRAEGLPCLTVTETGYEPDTEPARLPGRGRYRIQWAIEALVPVTGNALQTLYDIEADVIRALFDPNDSLGALTKKLTYSGRQFSREQAGSDIARLVTTIVTWHNEN